MRAVKPNLSLAFIIGSRFEQPLDFSGIARPCGHDQIFIQILRRRGLRLGRRLRWLCLFSRGP